MKMIEHRKPQFLSPSALQTWRTSKDEYYLKYLGSRKIPGILQTQPMAAGSAFDAYVKVAIEKRYDCGPEPVVGESRVTELLKSQVEKQNLDWAIFQGRKIFDDYCRIGAWDRLVKVLDQARLVDCNAVGTATVNGVPLLGKPDLVFWLGEMVVVLDWKVNGWCSQSVKRPDKGHLLSRNVMLGGIQAGEVWLETNQCGIEMEVWRDQLDVYGLVVGSRQPIIGWIDQLCCGGGVVDCVGVHRGMVEVGKVMDEMEELWAVVCDPSSFYTEERIEQLEGQLAAMSGGSELDNWYVSSQGRG
jgi:hypothetical protein